MTEIQITNRAGSRQRVTATLRDPGDDRPILEFILRPGETVIVPLQEGMDLRVAELDVQSEGRGDGRSALGNARWSGRLS